MFKRILNWKGLVAAVFVLGILSVFFIVGSNDEVTAGEQSCLTICNADPVHECVSFSDIGQRCDNHCGTCQVCPGSGELYCQAISN